MNRLMAKNTIASHLVALDRKFDEPREPNTVAEAPPPKPVPACAPEPRCIRISAIIEIATSPNNTLRTNINIGWTLGGGFPGANRPMASGSRRLGDGQEIGGHQRRPADHPALHVGLPEPPGHVVRPHSTSLTQPHTPRPLTPPHPPP